MGREAGCLGGECWSPGSSQTCSWCRRPPLVCTLWGGCPTRTDPAFGISPRSRLSSGKLQDLGVVEGSKLTLVPTVEAGLMSQASRPEQSVMQALESLTETQVRGWMPGQDGDRGRGRVGEGQLRPHFASPPKSFGVGASLRFHLQQGWERGGHWGAPHTAGCPCPPGSALGRGQATQWWGIKGRKGRRKKNTPWHRQLTELAPGWGCLGTAARLACQPGMGEGLGRAVGVGSPLLCPSDPSLCPWQTCGGNHCPQFGTRGTTTAPLLVPWLMRVPSFSPQAPAAPAPPMYCNAPHAAPVTAGMFRSHGASTQTVNSSVVSSCSEVDCGSRSSSSPGSSPAPSARSRKPGAVIESFVNHAPGVFSGTFSGTCC
ncbi:PREDICTED: midnolin [Corvus brachyrhynchos]|uniref:midnolin n=1 Tax=Corvus brachyrhynchos TaxID=85066 RepID=UPI00081655F7|nr:PREDICTED: midnolin [Corvus brachyrhynchos]